TPPGEVHEHLTHRARGCAEEVRATFPARRWSVPELEERLVNQLRRRERRRRVHPEMMPRDALELTVDEGVHLVGGRAAIGERRNGHGARSQGANDLASGTSARNDDDAR